MRTRGVDNRQAENMPTRPNAPAATAGGSDLRGSHRRHPTVCVAAGVACAPTWVAACTACAFSSSSSCAAHLRHSSSWCPSYPPSWGEGSGARSPCCSRLVLVLSRTTPSVSLRCWRRRCPDLVSMDVHNGNGPPLTMREGRPAIWTERRSASARPAPSVMSLLTRDSDRAHQCRCVHPRGGAPSL